MGSKGEVPLGLKLRTIGALVRESLLHPRTHSVVEANPETNKVDIRRLSSQEVKEKSIPLKAVVHGAAILIFENMSHPLTGRGVIYDSKEKRFKLQKHESNQPPKQ